MVSALLRHTAAFWPWPLPAFLRGTLFAAPSSLPLPGRFLLPHLQETTALPNHACPSNRTNLTPWIGL
jgi:hypothetical protein